MSREEAKQAMSAGKKITHRYFSPNEWATMENGEVVLEDGVRCDPDEFWRWRAKPMFDNDWSLYIE